MSRRGLPLAIALLAALGLAPLPCPAPAAEPLSVEFTSLRVGLADSYKLGLWTLVQLDLRASRPVAGRVEIVVPDGDGVPVRYSQAVSRGETTPLVYVRFGRPAASLAASFYAGDELVARREFRSGAPGDHNAVPPALRLDEHLFVSLGPGDPGLKEAISQASSSGWKARVVNISDLGRLPDRWYGYEAVDLLAVSTSRPEVFGQLDLNRLDAIDGWLAQGGKMLLAAGVGADRALVKPAPLSRFAPGRFAGVVALRQTEALETYCQSTSPVPPALEHGELRVARLADVQGTVEAREADLPLVVRQPRAFGQVVFLGADLDRPPLARWKGRPLLIDRLVDLPGEPEEAPRGHAIMHYGFVDVAGQLRAALEHFQGVSLVPFWVVAVLVAAYIALIGPIDYFLLRRFARRMVLTWITFPSSVLVVSAAACGLAFWLKGDRVRTSQVDLVEVDVASGTVRGTTWAGLFSPRPDLYDLSLRPRLTDGSSPQSPATLVSWFGMPGHGLGGMAPQASVPAVWPQEYHATADLSRLVGVGVPAWSTKGITARWTGRAKVDLQTSLVDQGQMLEGSLTNTLGVDLQRCLLIHDRWAYELGDLSAGQAAMLGATVNRSELATCLTGRRIVFDDTKSRYLEEVTPYDLASIDARQILQTMMFFQAAGSTRYTGLVNNYQASIDATDLLHTGRAMLVGFVAPGQAGRAGAELLRGDRPLAAADDPRTVAVRLVLPVKSSNR